ncbi:MAG: DMT family transporter [Anaerolineaceae bacterium]|nr:DMT family transporter [Anaerolineaceae bacterium]
MKNNVNLRTIGALAGATIFWASAFSAIRFALQYYSVGHIALFRFLTASILLIGIAFWKKIGLPKLSDLPYLVLLGIIAFTIYQLALVEGEKTVLAGTASMIIAASPIIVSILAAIFYKEHLSLLGWIGSLIGFCGVALISFRDLISFQLQPGALFIFGAAICISIYNVFQKHFHQKYSVLQFTVYSVVSGTIFLLFKSPGLIDAMVNLPFSATASVIYLGIFPTVASFLLWNYGLRQVSASVASSFHYLTPVIAVLIAWVWLAELPTWFTMAGGVLTVIGVIIVTRWGKIITVDHH